MNKCLQLAAILLSIGFFCFNPGGADGQTLGNQTGNYMEINSISGLSANTFFNKRWLVRDANGPSWLTARLHDGISIDVSHLVPWQDTKTWWERDPYHNIQSWGNEGETHMILSGGRLGIGIGKVIPVATLSLQTPHNGWLVTSKAYTPDGGNLNGIKLLNGYPNEDHKWAGVAAIAENTHSNNTGLGLYAGQTERIRITSTGNVGIGISSPNTRLAVNGTIRAKEVRVESANWPDYVFEDNYRLPDLAELEAYIKANKHLPGMPDKHQVASEGISLGEMNRLLLEKVEELTLRLIDKEKQLTEHGKALDDVKSRLKMIENR